MLHTLLSRSAMSAFRFEAELITKRFMPFLHAFPSPLGKLKVIHLPHEQRPLPYLWLSLQTAMHAQLRISRCLLHPERPPASEDQQKPALPWDRYQHGLLLTLSNRPRTQDPLKGKHRRSSLLRSAKTSYNPFLDAYLEAIHPIQNRPS